MPELHNKRILLGVTGGIAAYKAAELTRRLVKAGARVQVAMTAAATHFVTAKTFQALSGLPVITDLWDDTSSNGMAHIQLTRDSDLVVVAPATADFIARLAHGLAGDVLSALCLARTCPLMLAPAMNRQMWAHPATRRNVRQLAEDGVMLLGPAAGEQACGEVGEGRMLEPADLYDAIVARFIPPLLANKRVLITAGPTLEKLDPVRALTNLSSGKMGYAVARAALESGARVTLISGPTCLTPPPAAHVIHVESAAEMLQAVSQHVADADIFISVAAVADYRPQQSHVNKLKKTDATLTLTLVPNDDILGQVAQLPNPPFCVGFAAETEQLLEHGEAKRQRKHLPLLAVNRAQDALGSDDNELILLDDRGAHHLVKADKLTLARQLIAHLADLYTRSR
ncbi:phosphopantothenate synthase [Sulfuriferula sp. AH1]|uniref:bifunctional phosphopantothenoylcysteine decarboxylase/phosphopantothenate--cysteine ligase CoaBC n=1 Tax=Sulfuriferula sp. AH1 TaxID=1985873 RepID=UPI000B3B1F09|nr:bifunctional phosphopantothenoylcysteine decarboxylase/phosphopantothenate--cysteine ligase CoaBC [Sulfuriferula sp. AH1]ARU30395.1 phosphopantothenate synthase [Sulfuriferula sp. AH1]